MFKNAIEKINKFYDLDLNQNSHADEMFDVLDEVIKFDSAAIFYLSPNTLSLEYGKNFEIFEDVKFDDKTTEIFYNEAAENITEEVKKVLNIKDYSIACRLTVKNAVLGILVITRKDTDFSIDEKLIFKTCSKIISNLIKDLEVSKILKMQVKAMEEGIIETHQAYKTIQKQNKKIKENEKLQNQFIANVSHDLRTPLNSIIGFSEVLAQNIFGELNQKQNEYIEDIRIAGIRLLGMINEILDISKLESHTIKLNISNVDINMLCNEVCNILKPLCQKKNIKIIKNISDEISISADYIKLQQVLFNILGNAIKFSPENSEIDLSAKLSTKNVAIKIKDHGIGIDKKYHKKIFNKFFQVEDSFSKSETSTGLGLTIAKEFVKLHKGEIKIESKPGDGTVFTIIIPNMND